MNKKKRYYKIEEVVYIREEKTFGVIKGLNINPEKNTYRATVEYEQHGVTISREFELWEIDKDKRRARDKFKKDTVLFAKVKEGAVIPTKNKEDAGYDVYACIDEPLTLKVGVPTLVPTGIASSISDKYYFNVKHERGSTGKLGMSVLAGVVDSGYRGEWFVNITALHKDIVLLPTIEEIEVNEDFIAYPTSKAIAQATLDLVPDVNIKEISYEELKEIPSQRGTTKLGQSGK